MGSCSRDPIGYADGYNLFGAYFVPDKLDPTGEGLDSITGLIEACLKPPKQCTPKGKAWLEWYKKVIEETLERYAKNPKTPGVVDGTKEQLRRLDIVNKMLKACE